MRANEITISLSLEGPAKAHAAPVQHCGTLHPLCVCMYAGMHVCIIWSDRQKIYSCPFPSMTLLAPHTKAIARPRESAEHMNLLTACDAATAAHLHRLTRYC